MIMGQNGHIAPALTHDHDPGRALPARTGTGGGNRPAGCDSQPPITGWLSQPCATFLWRGLLTEVGQERSPPFLERREPSPELFQLAVDACQFRPCLLFPEVPITMPGPREFLDLAAQQSQPWVSVHRGRPVLEVARVDRLDAQSPS